MVLSLDGTKLTCIKQDRLYESLYDNRRLKYWYGKENLSQTLENKMWEESWLATRWSIVGLWQLDSKLLWNQCGLAKTLYNRGYQDTHNFPAFSSACEDRDHLLTFPDPLATKIVKSGINFLKKYWKKKRQILNYNKLFLKHWIHTSQNWPSS